MDWERLNNLADNQRYSNPYSNNCFTLIWLTAGCRWNYVLCSCCKAKSSWNFEEQNPLRETTQAHAWLCEYTLGEPQDPLRAASAQIWKLWQLGCTPIASSWSSLQLLLAKQKDTFFVELRTLTKLSPLEIWVPWWLKKFGQNRILVPTIISSSSTFIWSAATQWKAVSG